MGQKQAHCCVQESRSEFDELSMQVQDDPSGIQFVRQRHAYGAHGVDDFSEHPRKVWECCKADDNASVQFETPEAGPNSMIESLNYLPVRFDEGNTFDVERSHTRYSKIIVHSTRARTQRRSKAWEDWLRGATAGRAVTLLSGFGSTPRSGANGDTEGEEFSPCSKVAATYFLDRGLTKLSVLPTDAHASEAIMLLVDNIQVICPASDFMLFFDQIQARLDESEKARAVLLQYVTEDTERKRLCFLEESEAAKDRFVQALTALWLEKRNDHSMWF